MLNFLRASSASSEFHDAVNQFVRTSRPNDRVSFPDSAPPVKIERTLTKLLAEHGNLPIESVEINAVSGCSSFTGEAVVRAADDVLRIVFEWDCRWKALQLGWTDYFGFPDQLRAAREFGYDCFRAWELVGDPLPA